MFAWTNLFEVQNITWKDFIGIIPSSIPAFLHFILASITKIIFHIHVSHEQVHIGYFVWNVSLLYPAWKDFKGIIPSFILAFLLMFIAEIILYFQRIHEQFHIGFCVWKVCLLHPARKEMIGSIPSLSRLFCISCWYLLQKSFIFMVFMNSSR